MPNQRRKKQLFKRNSRQKLYDQINATKEKLKTKEFNKNPKARKNKN